MPQNLVDFAGGLYSPITLGLRESVSMGDVPGATSYAMRGHAYTITAASLPIILSEEKVDYPFLTAASSLEVLSSSVDDSATGTGARTVLVMTLDANGYEVDQVVTLNGTTPVALSGTHLYENFAQVMTAGSQNKNAGNITIRTVGSQTKMGYIAAGIGTQRILRYTVPKGKKFLIDGISLDPNDASHSSVLVSINMIIRNTSGVELVQQTKHLVGDATIYSLPTPIPVMELETYFIRITSVTVDGGAIEATVGGIIVPNP